MWLQDVQQELLDVAGGQLVDVLGGHVSRPDLQLMFHGLDNPSGDPQYTYAVNHLRIEPCTAHMGAVTLFEQG